MNWLAHAMLSEPDADAMLGNLLADLIRGTPPLAISPGFARGVARHWAIDRFTDAHPVVARSRWRVPASHRRFAGILTDVFYDHVLARNWLRFTSEPLGEFTARVYRQARLTTLVLPNSLNTDLLRIAEEDRLGSYARRDGIELALSRLTYRLTARGRSIPPLGDALPDMLSQFDDFAADFDEFFPQLQAHLMECDEQLRM